jgi:hypothetical protein
VIFPPVTDIYGRIPTGTVLDHARTVAAIFASGPPPAISASFRRYPRLRAIASELRSRYGKVVRIVTIGSDQFCVQYMDAQLISKPDIADDGHLEGMVLETRTGDRCRLR